MQTKNRILVQPKNSSIQLRLSLEHPEKFESAHSLRVEAIESDFLTTSTQINLPPLVVPVRDIAASCGRYQSFSLLLYF